MLNNASCKMFHNSSVMLCGPTPNTFFSCTVPYYSVRGCVKKNFTLWRGRRIFKLRTVLDPTSVDVKTYLVCIEMEYSLNSSVQSQNYLGMVWDFHTRPKGRTVQHIGLVRNIQSIVMGGVDN